MLTPTLRERIEKMSNRTTTNGFVGIYLTKELLEKLDKKVAETTLNRSQIIRLALIEYLKNENNM